MPRISVNVFYYVVDGSPSQTAMIYLETGIDSVNVWNDSLLDGQVITHEAVKLIGTFCIMERLLHWIPVILIEFRLFLIIEPHQDVVADQVGLGQIHACRVETFKNQLWIVMVFVERNLNNNQFADTDV